MTHDEKIASETLQSPKRAGPGGDLSSGILQNPIERQIVEAWETILGVTSVKVDDSFFDLGGNSLSVIRFMSWVLET
jgi:hypothetical protein